MSEIITKTLLKSLTEESQKSLRLRKNHNFHQELSAISQRLLIGIEPGSYIRPHKHLSKDETMLMVAGKMGIIFFNEDGSIQHTSILLAGGENVGANIAAGTFHSLVSLESGTIFFESKDGPYQLLSTEEVACWAPAETDDNAKQYYQELEQMFL